MEQEPGDIGCKVELGNPGDHTEQLGLSYYYYKFVGVDRRSFDALVVRMVGWLGRFDIVHHFDMAGSG